LKRPIFAQDLKRHVQVVIAPDRARERHPQSWGPHWHVGCFDTAMAALRKGLGYAWLPRHLLQDYLAADCLRVLPMEGTGIQHTSLYVVFGKLSRTTPGAQRLANLLHETARGETDQRAAIQ
jgi:DNA-binding transcriptional LysR family regulator